MLTIKKLALALGLTLAAHGAQAALVNVLFGDKDCFGIPAQGGSACATGLHFENDLGGVFFSDYRQVGDPAVTDIWHIGSQSFTIDLVLPSGLQSAELDLFHAGAGTAGAGSITINGTLFGAFGSGNNLSSLTAFDITSVIGNSNQINIQLSVNDGWALDYAEIRMQVPEPGSLGMAALALAALAFVRRRRLRL